MNLFEQFKILTEKKDHLIKKLVNLSDEEKQELIDFFNKKPNLENKIDWQNKNLKFDDFKLLMQQYSEKKIEHLKLVRGEDYIPLILNGNKAYIPLNYKASVEIASDNVGSCRGTWCTADSETRKHWSSYTGKDIVFIYIIYKKTKYAIACSLKLLEAGKQWLEIFDEFDNHYRNQKDGVPRYTSMTIKELTNETGITEQDILKYKDLLVKANEIIQENRKKISIKELIDEIEEDCYLDMGMGQYKINNNFEEADFRTFDSDYRDYIFTNEQNFPKQFNPASKKYIKINISHDEVMELAERLEGADVDEYRNNFDIWDYFDEWLTNSGLGGIIDFLEENNIQYDINYEIIEIQDEHDGSTLNIFIDKLEYKKYYHTELTEQKIREYENKFSEMFNATPIHATINFDGFDYMADIHQNYDYWDKDQVIKEFIETIVSDSNRQFSNGEIAYLRKKLEEIIPEELDYQY